MAGVGVPQHFGHFGRIWAYSGIKVQDWKGTAVLIVDEVSMLDAEFVDWLSVTVAEAVAEPYVTAEEQEERRAMGYAPPQYKPFGGRIQLIFCGDFLQLPPVQGSRDEAASLREAPSGKQLDGVPYGLWECAAKPAFMSVCWREANLEVVELRTVHRQRDVAFMRALNAIRLGVRRTPEIEQLLRCAARPLPPRNGVEPTRLFPTNDECNGVNESKLAALPGALTTVASHDVVEAAAECPKLADARRAHGAKSAELAAAEEEVRAELRKDEFFVDGHSAACRVPAELALKLGAQVMLLRNEGPGGFVNGDTGLVVGFEAVQPGSEEHEQLKKELPAAMEVRWPRVRFARSTRGGREEKLVLPVKFERRVFRRGTCVRWQSPLRLSWAITIHKSQGMSLPYVVCDLGRAFAPGQVYVALSRATSVEGLQILRLDPGRIQVSFAAKYFHAAASEASAKRATAPLEALWARSHFWWLPLVNTANAHPRWLELYEGRVEASQLQRWRATFPVPQNLCSPSMQGAVESTSEGAS